jgi:site-specific recombinase XerC
VVAALRGLRRSELAGLRWADLDHDHRQLVIVRARTTAGYQVFESPPKSAASMPPVRLHALRHGAATLAHLAGTDMKTISDQLGHSSIVLTADTYTSVLPAAQYKAAEATAQLVLDAARNDRHHIAIVARQSRVAAHKYQKVLPLTLTTDQGSSQLTGRQPNTQSDHWA